MLFEQHIRMISVGSSDTKDWINDAENSAWTFTGIYDKSKKIQIKNCYFKL